MEKQEEYDKNIEKITDLNKIYGLKEEIEEIHVRPKKRKNS